MISRRSLIKGILSAGLLPLSLFNRQQENRKCYVNIEMFFETVDGSPVPSPPGDRIIYCVEVCRKGDEMFCNSIEERAMRPQLPVFISLPEAFDYLNQ